MGIERDELIEDTLITLSHVQEHLNELTEMLGGKVDDKRHQKPNITDMLLSDIIEAMSAFYGYQAYCLMGVLDADYQEEIQRILDNLSDAYANIDHLCNMHKEKSRQKSYSKNAQKSRKTKN